MKPVRSRPQRSKQDENARRDHQCAFPTKVVAVPSEVELSHNGAGKCNGGNILLRWRRCIGTLVYCFEHSIDGADDPNRPRLAVVFQKIGVGELYPFR